ncbi:hypothetical protein VNI00_004706 [Paramarasmius palmivorus]|uniref:F-box domain-containing protein n=1 Tax=Paramarasmius palmivorus TaxID=297713 RepID=A0AAW0DHY8_9AGAR
MPSLNFLEFPVELQTKLLKTIHKHSDRFALISTCSQLYNAFYIDVVASVVRDVARTDVFGFTEPITLGGDTKIEKYRPIIFVGAVKKASTTEGNITLEVQVVLPRFMPGNDEWEYGDVVVEGRNVYVNGANKKEYKKTVSVIGYEQAA